MPTRKKSTATQAPCNGCGCCSRDPEDHTCPIAQKVPPQTMSKPDFLKPIKEARKAKTPTARQIASAPVYKPGVAVKLPRGAKPSTDKDYMRLFASELCGGPPLSCKERVWLVLQVADATWSQHNFAQMGIADAIQAFKDCKIVANPWDFDWFPGFVNSRAAGMKRKADSNRANGATRHEESQARFDDEDFEGLSGTHDATYMRLAKQLANEVAKRDNKKLPSYDEIWANSYHSVWKSNFRRPTPSTRRPHRIYWLDIENRLGDTCAGCLRKFGGRAGGMRFLVMIEHRNGGPHDGELSDAPSCHQCNTASRARADAAAAALHVHDATYTRHDAGTLGRGRLALMGRGSDDAAARRLAAVRAATVTRSADDAALEEAHVSTPARDRGGDVERFDGDAIAGSYSPYMKPCPACAAMIASACRKCPKCGEACTKKRKSK